LLKTREMPMDYQKSIVMHYDKRSWILAGKY
jgi:hypothetical protein